MDSGRKTRVIVGALLGLLFVGIVALGSIFRTVVFTVAAVIAVYEMSNMIDRQRAGTFRKQVPKEHRAIQKIDDEAR